MTNQGKSIAAISTAPGVGGIAVIRISGTDSIELTDKIFKSKANKKLIEQEKNTIHYGEIISKDEIIDEVLISVFHAPHSFTGENTVEIACHGSLFIQQRILQELLEAGATLATAGEFTQRAFLNGKMDLSQAESVADLIASTSSSQHRLALKQMKGGVSNKLKELRSRLVDFISLIELELDFSEEDVEFADRTNLKKLVDDIASHIKKLADSFSVGNAIKMGIPVAIVGETNAGKSTLLNLLLDEDKAIVSDIHGTTRDVIEDQLIIDGTTFRLIDTAGIRETKDVIENIGIKRTFKKMGEASIILWVVDANISKVDFISQAVKMEEAFADKQVVLVFNKIDTVSSEKSNSLQEWMKEVFNERILMSAKEKIGLNQLEKILVDLSGSSQISQQDVIVTNIRHYEALIHALEAINRVADGLQMNIPTDFIAQDIRQCMHYLGEITGAVSTDEILGNIFSKFCIGK